MQAVEKINSRTVVLPVNDIDTDQIIPARFLTTTSRDGLGENLFHDWRYNGPIPKVAESSSPGTISAAVRLANMRPGLCSISAFAR